MWGMLVGFNCYGYDLSQFSAVAKFTVCEFGVYAQKSQEKAADQSSLEGLYF